jgi:hypothetical protein
MLRGWVVTLIVVGLAGLARADAEPDPEGPPDVIQRALRLAQEGAAEGNHDKLTEAIGLFKQGYQLNPNPVILCNIGQAYRIMGQLPRAHMMMAECMRRLPAVQPTAVASFRPVLDEIEAALPEEHVAVDVVSTPEGARLGASVFADDETVQAPAVIWLPEGVHTITASFPGFADSRQEVTITGDDVAGHPRKSVKLELQPEETGGVDPIVEPEPIEPPDPRRKIGWISLAGGVALLAGGGAMHAVAYDTRKDLVDGLSGDAYRAKKKTFETQRAVTFTLYGVGAAAAVTGAVLLYLSPRHGDRVRIEPTPAGDGATVWLDLSP